MKLLRFTSGLWLLVLSAFLLIAQSTSSKSAQPARSSSATSSSDSKMADSEKLDINTATKDQLEALPGIGTGYSQKIISGRPYNSKRDLLIRKILPPSTYEGIQDKIIAHRTGSTGADKGGSTATTGTKAAATPKPQ